MQEYYDSICEMVDRLMETGDYDEIYEDPLSIRIRSDWHQPFTQGVPYEYEILLATGGPEVRIYGILNDHMEPATARLQHRDWFTTYQDYSQADEKVLLHYADCFVYGD